LENRKALATAKVTTARPLSSAVEAELRKEIQKATGADEVLLQNDIDKSVLGGIRIETASRVWDKTLSRKLSELREVF
jgi:F0F1-type ATP synthase delta subunit